MKYTAVLATVVAVASAQACDTSVIPSCARSLIDSNVKAITGCEATDYKCICTAGSQTKLTAAISAQVIAACGADKVGEVLSGTEKFCAAVAAGACSSGSGSGSGSGSSAAAQSSSTTAAPTSASATTKPSSSVTTTTTTVATTSSRPSSVTVPSPSTNGTKPTSPPVPAGAGVLTAAGSTFVIALVGVLALL